MQQILEHLLNFMKQNFHHVTNTWTFIQLYQANFSACNKYINIHSTLSSILLSIMQHIFKQLLNFIIKQTSHYVTNTWTFTQLYLTNFSSCNKYINIHSTLSSILLSIMQHIHKQLLNFIIKQTSQHHATNL
jgi:hypothetical protein